MGLTSNLAPCGWLYAVTIPIDYTLDWPSFSKAFADVFRRDRSAVPIATPNPCAVLQPEDIVSTIAVVCLDGRQSAAMQSIANYATARDSYFLFSPKVQWLRCLVGNSEGQTRKIPSQKEVP